MTTVTEERARLVRAFMTALEHLRDVWDVQYLPAGDVPRGPEAARAPAAASASSPAPVAGPPPAAPTKAPFSAGVTPSGGPAAAFGVARAEALREQAKTWSAATKLEYLRRRNIGDCRRCGLCRTRTNIVFGVGNPEADIMFVGEAPGADEDRLGEPFVGRAGQRLDAWTAALGLRREDVYIANVLKCRPPGNRDPAPEEVDRCAPFLQAQIRAIEPKVIVALGRHAGMLLSRREDLTLRAMRGGSLVYDATGPKEAPGSRTIPLVVTYHPAFVLRKDGTAEESMVTDAVMSDLRRAVEIARRVQQ